MEPLPPPPKWKPHDPIPVESTFNAFVEKVGGKIVSNLLPKSPEFENADYLFETIGVVAELKELQTELDKSDYYRKNFDILIKKLMSSHPEWRPSLLGGDGKYPDWFYPEYLRIFRPPIARIIKKANRQIRETKRFFNIDTPTGIMVFVNDDFVGVPPKQMMALASSVLTESCSSIDCFVYLTINRYIEVQGSKMANLIWAPVYSDRIMPSMHQFINDLGAKWFDYLQIVIGPFDESEKINSANALDGAKCISHNIRRA